MSRPKAFVKQSKSRRLKEQSNAFRQTPETADEYQAAGVDLEEAGSKWRAGDGVKSMRFFTKAVEMYDNGLMRFPNSFDLAYNKARAQYEIVTHPVLVKQVQGPRLASLQTALASHRYALSLGPNDADTLFNMAGVLTSIAEEIAKDANLPDTEALSLLEEALELQNRCLSIQEYQFTESQDQQAAMLEEFQPVGQIITIDDQKMQPTPADVIDDQPEEQWAAIMEPVTKDTLIDTTEAQLSTLTTLCSILNSSAGLLSNSSLAWVEEYSSKLVNVKIPAYLEGTTKRSADIALAKANFSSALLEAGFRSGSLDLQTYKRERDAAFATSELNLPNSPTALLADATSLIALNSAIADTSSSDIFPPSSVRWNALSSAIAGLAKASKSSDMSTEDLPKTHLLRGEASMLQFQLSKPEIAYYPAVSNAVSLLKNAEVFYRNASKLARDDEQRNEALLREYLASFIQDKDSARLKIRALGDRIGFQFIAVQVEDLVSEGLITRDDVDELNL